MRLHRLDIQAFGPFATTSTVDFDTLSEAGLFLLSGATGSGKTSVLDAVCFALYGDVPGDRSTAKRLRSDQADPATPPLVTLEATLGGRRFRIVRSPAWERAKKRGTGTTTEPAKVTISEHTGGSWQPLSSRLDETGDLVVRLLGLDLTQFTQVAMLPQGRFQAFLRARSDERHRLLQQLFRTGRFEAVEQWLREHRLALARSVALEHQRLADVVSRASEAAATALPAGGEVHDLTPLADDGSLRRWLAERLDDALGDRDEAAGRLDALRVEEVDARARLEAAQSELVERRRLVEARRERDELVGEAATHAEHHRRLDAARRAAGVVPWHRQAVAAEAAHRSALTDAAAAADVLAAHLGRTPAASRLRSIADAAVADVAKALALRPRAARLDHLGLRLSGLGQRRAQLETELTRVRHEREVRPGRLDVLRAEVAAAREAARAVDVLTTAAQDARTRLDAHRRAESLRPQLAEAREEWLAARDLTLTLKEGLVALQLARIDGMAAELAGALAVGACCPVCGSAEHPTRAHPAPGAPDATSERSARSEVDDAEVVAHARDQRVRELEHALAAALARAGDAAGCTLAPRLAELQASLSQALRVSGRLPDLETRLVADRAGLDDLLRRAETLAADLAATATEHDALTGEQADLHSEVAAALGDHADVSALESTHRRTVELCRTALHASETATGADRARLEAARARATAVAEAGFDDLASALGAALDPAALARLADTVSRHERRLAAVTGVLSAARADDDTPLPDVDALARDHHAALDGLETTGAAVRVCGARATRLARLLDELDESLAGWAPLRHDLDVATRLSAFVEGKSSDNVLRMRLSAYVLAYRLSQVVAAANERLARMSDQRYSLEHTGRRGAGETRGGLSLLVRDDWSGESRDPATLSGGETFVVSLALALGLADVIAHEAGGAALDTLFVDEGFGSLDADTLDDVMDTLDSLRDGGRVVGVVSHVAEMRDRIPTQLHVTKARRGSTLAVRR